PAPDEDPAGSEKLPAPGKGRLRSQTQLLHKPRDLRRANAKGPGRSIAPRLPSAPRKPPAELAKPEQHRGSINLLGVVRRPTDLGVASSEVDEERGGI